MNYQNPIRTKKGNKRITCWVILIILTALLLSCQGTEEPGFPEPLVYVNHVYVTLDSATYTSVSNSDFLQDFAYCVTKTVGADSNQSWTGTYVWGEKTYIEFFNIGEYENKGYSGIGFGVEIENGIDTLYERFTSAGIENVSTYERTRQVEEGDIPWFNMLGFFSEDTTATFIINTWLMEYNPAYMKYKYPDKNPDSLEITRKFYNQKEYQSDLLLKDIVEIEMALNEFDHKKLMEELTNYGYRIEQKEELIIANGPDIRIIIRAASDNESGVCRIKFSLTDNQYEPQTVSFSDKSKLVLNADRTAEWYFSI